MNAVYSLPARMLNTLRWGEEKLNGGERDNKQFNHFDEIPADSPLRAFFKDPDTVLTPRVLKDGADSVGALGALNRVFINIGLFSEEWLQHINPLVGGKPFTPFPIKIAEQNSSYWRATEQQTLDGALFFLVATPPDHLKDAPGGKHYLTDDEETLEHGKKVFAEHCAACHSSKLPDEANKFFPDKGCVGPDYLKCWNQYWHWTNSPEFKEKMTKLVMEEDFLKENFLSTELRIPVTLLETNICASIATNAIQGDTWDNFSSTSYKKFAFGRKSTDPSSSYTQTCRLRHARRGAWLYSSTFPFEHLVYSPIFTEQYGREILSLGFRGRSYEIFRDQYRAAAMARKNATAIRKICTTTDRIKKEKAPMPMIRKQQAVAKEKPI